MEKTGFEDNTVVISDDGYTFLDQSDRYNANEFENAVNDMLEEIFTKMETDSKSTMLQNRSKCDTNIMKIVKYNKLKLKLFL